MLTRAHKFVALLLLVLWLPATQHCGLEAAGAWVSPGDCHDTSTCESPHNQSSCGDDNCEFLEDSAYRSSFDSLKISAPDLTVLACLCCLHDITPETIVVPMISPARTDVPPELALTWQFTTRAAPSPRAPSFLA
ncbi:MAG: hypothetical protein K9M98_12560 [Cephaloticoccus sp.]|nr:hypothetical protein [Cephaloticoccus sp.]